MKRILAAAVGIALLSLLPLSAGAATLAEAGKSAVLMDVTTGTVLYEHNSHEALAPASVTKVMTMLLIMEAVDSGKIAPTDTVTASEAAAAKGGSQIYLKAGGDYERVGYAQIHCRVLRQRLRLRHGRAHLRLGKCLRGGHEPAGKGAGDAGHPFCQLHRPGR